jgi:hypothetical protein
MAAGDGNRCVRNAAHRLTFPIRLATTGALVSGASSLDSEVSLNGGAFSDCTNEATEIGSTGIYTLDLTAAENTGTEVVVQVKTGTANAVIPVFTLLHEPCTESGVAQSATATTIRLRSAASYGNDWFNGCSIEIVRGTGAGQTRTITDYVDSTDTATVDRAWITNPDSTSVYIVKGEPAAAQTNAGVADSNLTHIDSNTAAVAIMKALYKGGAVSTTISDATPSATEFDLASGVSTTDDFYNLSYLVFVSGTHIGKGGEISDYTGATRTVTLANALTSAPANGDEVLILGHAS